MDKTVSSCVTITEDPFDTCCVYDGRPLEAYSVELSHASDDSQWATIALRNVEAVQQALTATSAIDAPTSGVRERNDCDGVCLYCEEPVSGHGVVIEQPRQQKHALVLHYKCCDEVAEQLEDVWEHVDVMLSGVLSY